MRSIISLGRTVLCLKSERAKSAIEVLRRLQKLSDTLELVSFDVFDTLIRRRIMPPERSKVPAAVVVSRMLREKGIKISRAEVSLSKPRIECG